MKSGANIKIIPVDYIIYREAEADYVKIYIVEGYFMKKKMMGYYDSTFDPQTFVHVYRSCSIHIKQITRIEPIDKDQHVALLNNRAKIPISRSGYQKLRTVLGSGLYDYFFY